jgi:hypothetical protein
MIFHVGQRVICTNVTPRRDGLHPRYASTAIPVLGAAYTIRAIFDARPYGHDDVGTLLEEVVNPIRRYISQRGPVTVEQFWLAYRFRPLRTTNIDVFLRMLEPEPAVELIGWATERIDAEARRVADLTVGDVIHLGAGPPRLDWTARQRGCGGR